MKISEMVKKKINRNLSEALAKEQNDAQDSAEKKKKVKRAKEKARRLRSERNK